MENRLDGDLRQSLGSRNGSLVNVTSRYLAFGVLIYMLKYMYQ